MTRNPLLDFEIDRSAIAFIGRDLQRPECILAEPDGTLWSADARGGVVKIGPNGSQQIVNLGDLAWFGATVFQILAPLQLAVAMPFATLLVAASVALSVTSLDPALQRAMEPRAAPPRLRLAAIERLAKAGVPVGVMVPTTMPSMITAITC